MRSVIGLMLFLPGAALWTLGFMMAQEQQWTLCVVLCLVGGFMVGVGGYMFMVKPR